MIWIWIYVLGNKPHFWTFGKNTKTLILTTLEMHNASSVVSPIQYNHPLTRLANFLFCICVALGKWIPTQQMKPKSSNVHNYHLSRPHQWLRESWSLLFRWFCFSLIKNYIDIFSGDQGELYIKRSRQPCLCDQICMIAIFIYSAKTNLSIYTISGCIWSMDEF